MSRLLGVATVVLVVLVAMGFAAANAGNRATLNLGFFILYHVPVTLVAFSGLFVGMLVMFATGIHSDLKVRRVLRERFAEESRREQTWIDRTQQDLFADAPSLVGDGTEGGPVPGEATLHEAGSGEPPSDGPVSHDPTAHEPVLEEPAPQEPNPDPPTLKSE